MKTKFIVGWRIFAIVPLLAASACLRAATPGAETKLLPSDLFGFRHFGSAVAIDGDSAVVGVPLDPENGSSAGAAYVFLRTGTDWTQQAKLTALDASFNSEFGYSVGISGDTVVVGAHLNSDAGIDAGAAYVFVRNGTTWTQQAKLMASDAAEEQQFGSSVAAEGDTIVVGAIGDAQNFFNEGAVYVFTRSSNTWTQQTKLLASEPRPGNLFGFSLALNNSTLAVGSPFDDDFGVIDAGTVYVFVGGGAIWTQQAEVSASDAATDDRLGWSVALDGDTLVSGAPQNHTTADFAGAAYVFFRTNNTWSQQAKLVADDSAMFDCFGYSVAVHHDMAIIGSVLDSSFAPGAGSVYLFTRAGTVWSQSSEFSANDVTDNIHFGYSIAVSGGSILVGAPFGSIFEDGTAYVYAGASNTAPVANDQSVTTPEDAPVAVTLTGSDAEGGVLSFTVLTVPVNGALSGAAPNLIYTPNANFNGSDSFTFKVNDGELDSVPATVSISITPVNDAPVANNLSVITMEDTPVAMTLTGSDVEGSPLTFTVLSNPSLGTLSGTPPNLTYTPNGNANGPDSFTFKVNDGELDSVPATVSINITPVNDGPTLSDIPNQTIPANSTTGPVPFTVNDADNDPATLSVSGSSDYQLLVPDGNIVFGGSGADRTLTVTPAPDQSGTATITVTISDGVAVASKSFIVTVTTGNHAPIADASASETTAISHNKKNAMVTLDGSRSFDPDNDRLTYSWREYTTNLGSGAVLHEKLSVGTHVITLTVSDGSLIGTTTVTINVVTTVDAIGKLAKTMQASNLPIALKNELSASLKAAANMSLKGNMSACVNELRAFQKKVLAQSGKKIDRATAAALIRTAQTIINTISSR